MKKQIHKSRDVTNRTSKFEGQTAANTLCRLQLMAIIYNSRAVGSLVVRASDSRPEGLGSGEYFLPFSLLAEIVEVEIEVVAIYRPFGEVSLSLNRTVTCMVLKANDKRTSCPCHDEFRGPRSDYVRQVGLFGIQVGQFRAIMGRVGSNGVNGVCNTTMHQGILSQFRLDHLQPFTVSQGRSRRPRGCQRGRVGKFHIRLVFHSHIRVVEEW
ncbi:uncharacterized protein TNCV_2648581 [Trichonephila clavipes]|nr:uncharacterized protein TNCV_2648581 [Trichonephila clavipes]